MHRRRRRRSLFVLSFWYDPIISLDTWCRCLTHNHAAYSGNLDYARERSHCGRSPWRPEPLYPPTAHHSDAAYQYHHARSLFDRHQWPTRVVYGSSRARFCGTNLWLGAPFCAHPDHHQLGLHELAELAQRKGAFPRGKAPFCYARTHSARG